MNRLAILSLGASVLLGGAAAAADLPVKGVPRAPAFAPPSWAGFYIGAHAGYGWKNNDFQEVIAVAPLRTVGGIGSEGWVAGGHFGHNWQYGAWVMGAELDLSATGIKGTSAAVVRNFAGGISITDTSGDDVQLLGTARARIGYTPFSDWLFYGTGGLAWESADRIETNELIVPGSNQLVSTTTPRVHFGWVAGAGLETKLFGSN